MCEARSTGFDWKMLPFLLKIRRLINEQEQRLSFSSFIFPAWETQSSIFQGGFLLSDESPGLSQGCVFFLAKTPPLTQ